MARNPSIMTIIKQGIIESERENRRRIRELKAQERYLKIEIKENNIRYAKEITDKAEIERNVLLSVLKDSISKQKSFCLQNYIIRENFSEEKPIEPLYKTIPVMPELRVGLNSQNFINKLKKLVFEKIHKIKSTKWKKLKEKLDVKNQVLEGKYTDELVLWQNKQNAFEEHKASNNNKLEKYQMLLNQGKKEGVEFYFDLALTSFEYESNYFDCDYKLEYKEDSHILVVDFSLPLIDDIPKIKQVKYIATRDEFAETLLLEKDLAKIYDEILYQMTLRVVYGLYSVDDVDLLDSIVFNGWITQVNKANGKIATNCILTLQTTKSKFMQLNLYNVDPKVCFKGLKGISGAKLCDFVPVAPILKLDTNDSRFVESYNVVEKIEGFNLAAIDWADFEHLIREIFEKEFAPHDGEIKITRASKDGGVDAVIFDPDPIRGGKFIIQAKRYTNVVGVSAVRDLYGTLMNEGAVKGILVTTSHYGADSYEFAKDKPLTLLDGSNLLHLLEKHGHKAYINLMEAKKLRN
ncbi:MAG: hypothetical protein K0R14_1955 [Burkholderiales bacterium]|jgi:restriction system protein|nr:hypothetical protein [Burkholderiales bacterium]